MRWLLLLSIFFTASCASYLGPKSYDIGEEFYYTSSKDERQKGRSYIPEGDGPFPGVVLVHAGSWNSRSYEDMRYVAKTLATHGFSVISINYRLAPKFHHPAPVEDLESAVKYFKKHATKFKLDPEKIGLWGYSSGAHSAAYYALTRAKDPNLKVQAVVAGGGPFNLAGASDNKAVIKYMGFLMKENPQAYYQASPQYLVNPNAPPFFLYHALKDKQVDHYRSTDFEKVLKENGVPVERHDIKYLGHVTTFVFSFEAQKKGLEFLQKYLYEKKVMNLK